MVKKIDGKLNVFLFLAIEIHFSHKLSCNLTALHRHLNLCSVVFLVNILQEIFCVNVV